MISWSLEMIFFSSQIPHERHTTKPFREFMDRGAPPPLLKFTTWITKFNIAFCSLSKKKKEGGVFKVIRIIIRIIYILLGFPAHYNRCYVLSLVCK